MKRIRTQLLTGAIAAGLCVAVVIILRPTVWRTRPQRAPATGSPPAPVPSTPETTPRFSRDPEHLRKLWERIQAHQGLDPFTGDTPTSFAAPASGTPSNLMITAVWRQRGKSLVVINGRIFSEGSEIAPYRITRIGPHDAELAGPGGTIRLDLSSPRRGAVQAGHPVAPSRIPNASAHLTSTVSTP